MPARARSRLLFLTASVALHLGAAGLLLVLWRAPGPEPAPRATLALDVELAAPPAPPPAPRAVPVPDARPATSRRPHPSARGPVSNPAPAPAPEVEPMALAMRGPDLDLARDPAPQPAEPSRRPDRAREPESVSVKRRLDGLLAADRARMNVRLGNVAPVLYDIQRDAEKALHPDWALTEADPKSLGSVASTARFLLRALGRQYLETLARHRTAYRQAPGKGQVEAEAEQGPSFTDVLTDVVHGQASDRGVELASTLCLEIGPDGSPTVRSRRGSGRPEFDELARRAVRIAARVRQRDVKRPTEACYRVSARFLRLPPLPFICGSFDEVLLKLEVYYPLKKLLRTRVALVSARQRER